MKRHHDMPFGAQVTAQGVRFRFWSPGFDQPVLRIEGGQQERMPMEALGEGWFELVVPDVIAGMRYCFEVNDGLCVPDPASRCNPDDVHGPSEVVDPASFGWQDGDWHGRPWEEAVVYELHVGTFSPEGTFAGVMQRLDYLVELGVTAIELMPVADFPGARNWGYDGVLPFAPDSSYGTPNDLKALVQAAHAKGLMVILDVVYNHFGPEGNYLHVYAKKFFTERHHTPWGAAINFDGPGCNVVREFFIQNALYWIHEYHLDGLRLDAVHAIIDDSETHILTELSERVHASIGSGRHVHLILENDANEARYLGRKHYIAQWNDDIHHALHVLATGEQDGYYADYAQDPVRHLGRCLTEGFAYQGDVSPYRDHELRGEKSAHLPPQTFVSFIQCHDQVGNRAFGERISCLAPEPALRAIAAIYLLAPGIPMLFMGEEFAAQSPFLFFCDVGSDLREAVTEGRRREFSKFERFADPVAQASIPDPNLEQTFLLSKLDWGSLNDDALSGWLDYYRALIRLRRKVVVPRLHGIGGFSGEFEVFATHGLRVAWRMGDGSRLHLLANCSNNTIHTAMPPGESIFKTHPRDSGDSLGAWSVIWNIEVNERRT